jgi:hypothetical protein
MDYACLKTSIHIDGKIVTSPLIEKLMNLECFSGDYVAIKYQRKVKGMKVEAPGHEGWALLKSFKFAKIEISKFCNL